ncbi:MAG TPA: Crp/Fnr family transcriptional regulator [Candidatus Acidoferrales bacterium]|nr:Crp/Fnr family transcriptional regulator [Candidatus Acidoferrales bacterium]
MPVSPEPNLTGNLFLDCLSSRTLNVLRPSLRRTKLSAGETIYAPQKTIRDVFFPISSVISVVSEMSDGKISEIGIIGREGTTGLAVALGQSSTNHRYVVQVPDSALAMSAKAFRAAVEKERGLNPYLLRYAQAMIVTVSQSGACNQLHPIEKRCARWLLMAHDRVEGDVIALTHRFLGEMLGVRRAGVTVAVSALQKRGCVSYSRGRIAVADRERLEGAACECYAVVEAAFKKIIGYSGSKTSDKIRA